jgi:hypothetical protein
MGTAEGHAHAVVQLKLVSLLLRVCSSDAPFFVRPPCFLNESLWPWLLGLDSPRRRRRPDARQGREAGRHGVWWTHVDGGCVAVPLSPHSRPPTLRESLALGASARSALRYAAAGFTHPTHASSKETTHTRRRNRCNDPCQLRIMPTARAAEIASRMAFVGLAAGNSTGARAAWLAGRLPNGAQTQRHRCSSLCLLCVDVWPLLLHSAFLPHTHPSPS